MWDSILREHSRKEERSHQASQGRAQPLGQISVKAEKALQCQLDGAHSRSRCEKLVQLLANVFDTFGEKLASQFALGFHVQDLFRGGNGSVGGGAADVRHCLRFCLRDLSFSHCGASSHEILDPRLSFRGKPFGFGLGAGDDFFRFGFCGVLLFLIFRQELSCFVLELTRFVELGADATGTIVQRLRHHIVHAEISQEAYEDGECDRHPGFRLTQQFHGSRYLLRTSATAASITLSAGALPVSRSTIALAASVAMPCTFVIAVCLVPAIVFSASANLAWS